MSTTTTSMTKTGRVESRILREGYGEGAWHGPDLKAALADVTPDAAFRRPGPGRHNIAEIALHHAYYVHSVRTKVTGKDGEPFVLKGDDWFAAPDPSTMPWSKILDVVTGEQKQLADAVADIDSGRAAPAVSESEYFDQVLGITCHAVYHAGQIQLIKRLIEA